jgi:D-alanyl-D-alanine carboxypeptidase
MLNLRSALSVFATLAFITPAACTLQLPVSGNTTQVLDKEFELIAAKPDTINLEYISKNSKVFNSPTAKYIGLLDTVSNKFQGYNADQKPTSLASTAKIIVALVVLEDLELGKYKLTTSITIPDWARAFNGNVGSNVKKNLQRMLRDSDNMATNALIVKIGGFETLNSKLKKYGLEDSKINCLLSPKVVSNKSCIGTNQSTMRDMVYALNTIRIKNTSNSRLMLSALKKASNTFNHTNRVFNKYGINSNTLTDVGVVEVKDKEYVYAVNVDFKGSKDSGSNYPTAIAKSPTTSLKDKKDPVSKTIQWIVNDLEKGFVVKEGID